MTRILVPCILSLTVGVAAGWKLHPAAAAPIDSKLTPEHVLFGGHSTPVNSGNIDMSAMRAMIHEELRSALADSSRDVPSPKPAPKQATPEQLAQQRNAVETIDGLVAGGVWGEEQRRTFREKLVALDPEQREHALQQLTTGINSGTIRVTVDGSPL